MLILLPLLNNKNKITERKGMIFRHFINLAYVILFFSDLLISGDPTICKATNYPKLFKEQTDLIEKLKASLSAEEYKNLVRSTSMDLFLEKIDPKLQSNIRSLVMRCVEIDQILMAPATPCTCPILVATPDMNSDLDDIFDINDLSLAYTHPQFKADEPE